MRPRANKALARSCGLHASKQPGLHRPCAATASSQCLGGCSRRRAAAHSWSDSAAGGAVVAEAAVAERKAVRQAGVRGASISTSAQAVLASACREGKCR